MMVNVQGWTQSERKCNPNSEHSPTLYGPLPAGSLYGAKITQAGAAGSVGVAANTPFTIEWVLLGRTNQVSLHACDVCLQAHMMQ